MTNYEQTAFSKEACARLRGLIARYDVNQADLALLCDVSQSQFSKIIRGVRPMTVDQLAALGEALDLDLAEFLTEVDEFVRARDLKPSPVRFVEDGDRLDVPVLLYRQKVTLDPWAVAARSRMPEHRETSNVHQFPARNVPGSGEDDLDAVARPRETEPTDEQ